MYDLRILVTGGTFDKVYNPITEQLAFEETHVPEMLKLGRVTLRVAVEQLMLKDSLYMTDDDRTLILERCRISLEDRLLITHGTGTMVETAKVLGEGLEDKTAVLQGAIMPYSVNDSDAMFNFGFAMGAALVLPPGVYIAMNGTIFHWNDAIKNTERGLFKRKVGVDDS